MRTIRAALCLGLILALVCGPALSSGESTMSAYEQYLADGTLPSLKDFYQDDFLIGVAMPGNLFQNKTARETVLTHFNSITCENEMKADSTMDRQATLQAGDPDRVSLRFSAAKTALTFAQQNGLKMRAHTLVWHSQVPRWFFTEDWDNSPDAPLADRDRIVRRMENYICDMMTWINTNYPGIVYAWDVVNEAIEPAQGHPDGLRTDSLWYQTVGDDFVELAFAFARKYADPEQKLFYNDYNCYQKNKIGPIRNLLKKIKEQGNLDGLGMQSHIGIDSPSTMDYENALTTYASLGITIHVTELDVSVRDNSVMAQMQLAVRYRNLFAMLRRLREKAGVDIGSVTFWGLTDATTWLSNAQGKAYPLLFDRKYLPKPAFFGVLQDPNIPTMGSETRLRDAIEKLHLDAPASSEAGEVRELKPLAQHNPVAVQSFGADPWAMVYGDRVYLYMTGDEPVYGMDGSVQTNTYGNINTLRVLSSDDLVNWQDHGAVKAAGREGAAKWANNSWAPCAAWKNIDGRDLFFLYFANSAGGIGVLTSDSPTGPFTDPLGKPLISRATPTCASVTWLFDPAVLVDEDGSAYLYFGGGIPDGKAAAPGTARAVKLGADMISLDGDPVAIDAPWLFEDSGINRIGDTYLYSYCSNFQVPGTGSEQGFYSGEIVYMTSDHPLGPFTYAGRVLKNPGSYFGVGGNNHHCMFRFRDQWYIAYHAATVDRDLGWNAGYRSTFIDALKLGEDGLPALSAGTMKGVAQVKAFDPYRETEAETAASMAGMRVPETTDASCGLALESAAAGGWIGLSRADFGDEGALAVTLRWRGAEDGKVAVLLDSLDAAPAAEFDLPAAKDWQTMLFALPEAVTGVHNLYFRFSQAGTQLDRWQFHPASAVVKGPSLLTASDFPDISVIRVDDTYYMASTTMHFFPGGVLLRSHDLLHWEICGRVFDEIDGEPLRRLTSGKNCYGRGMWAPSLRYHEGRFYLVFTTADTHTTWLYQTEDIEQGPWTKQKIAGYYHDPSLFFDTDGKAYIAWGNTEIHLAELNPELTGLQPGGLNRVIARSHVEPNLGYEGSHLEKVGDRYDLFTIHSLASVWRRVETCLSSDSLEGTFTGGVVLNDDLGYCGQGVAQGGIVDTPDGRWFAVLFQDRGAVGRIPVLVPLRWDEGKPILGVNGKVPPEAVNLTTRPGYDYAPLAADDDFQGQEPAAMWEWNHMPEPEGWTMGDGALTLRTVYRARNILRSPNMLTVRSTWPRTSVTVTVDGSGLQPGDRAGLCALQVDWLAVYLTRTEEGLFLGWQAEGAEPVTVCPWEGEATLRLTYNFENMRDWVYCAVREGEGWRTLNTQPHKVTFDLGHFAGVRTGLFCQATEQTGGEARFTRFEYDTAKE